MNKAYSTLGIAYISKNLVLGQDEVINAIRKQRISLVLISSSSSMNTQKVVSDKCKYYEVNFLIINDNMQMAKAIGKKNIKVLAIKNKKLANNIYNQIKGEINGKS